MRPTISISCIAIQLVPIHGHVYAVVAAPAAGALYIRVFDSTALLFIQWKSLCDYVHWCVSVQGAFEGTRCYTTCYKGVSMDDSNSKTMDGIEYIVSTPKRAKKSVIGYYWDIDKVVATQYRNFGGSLTSFFDFLTNINNTGFNRIPLRRKDTNCIQKEGLSKLLLEYLATKDDINSVNLSSLALLGWLQGVPPIYMDSVIENDDVFMCLSTVVLSNNFYFMSDNIKHRYRHDVFKLNVLDTTDSICIELRKLNRRFVKLYHLLMETRENHCVYVHTAHAMLGTMKALCLRFTSLLDLLKEPVELDVSFFVPFIRCMPTVNYNALSKAITEGIVSVEAFSNKNIAYSLVESKQVMDAMWDLDDGIEDWRRKPADTFLDYAPVELLDLITSFLKSSLCRVNSLVTYHEIEGEIDTNDVSIPYYILSSIGHTGRCIEMISYWKIPPDSAPYTLNTLLKSTRYPKPELFTGFLFLLLKENREQDVSKCLFFRSLKIAIQATTTSSGMPDIGHALRALGKIFEMCKERNLLEVIDVKCLAVYSLELRRFFALDAIINLYPWIAKTWIDREGNTLLGLAVKQTNKKIKDPFRNFLLISHLLRKKPVLDSINLLSRDSLLTPSMIMVDVGRPSYHNVGSPAAIKRCDILCLMYTKGAILNCVNENGESLLHRAAFRNNGEVLRFFRRFEMAPFRPVRSMAGVVNFRRKLDGATPVMISLALSHLGFSGAFISLFKPKLNIRMGKSEDLGVAEYLFLNGNTDAVELIRRFSCVLDTSVFIKQVKTRKPDFNLSEEQFVCGGVGLTIVGEDNPWCVTPTPNFDGYIFPKLRASKRPVWLKRLLSGDIEDIPASTVEEIRTYNEDVKSCGICFNDYGIVRTNLTCGHHMCPGCWATIIAKHGWGNFSAPCPFCRATTSSVTPAQEVWEVEDDNCSVTCLKQRQWKRLSENRYAFFLHNKWTDETDL